MLGHAAYSTPNGSAVTAVKGSIPAAPSAKLPDVQVGARFRVDDSTSASDSPLQISLSKDFRSRCLTVRSRVQHEPVAQPRQFLPRPH